jgi:hypothetical protein
MKHWTDRFWADSKPGLKIFLQEMAITLFLGSGLGFIFNDLLFGLILGLAFGLASYFVQK